MSVRQLITENHAINTAYQINDDATVLTLANAQDIKVLHSGKGQPGYTSNATMGDELGDTATAMFLLVVNGAIEAKRAAAAAEADPMVSAGHSAEALLFESFVSRFNTTPEGLDFANDTLRTSIDAILTAGGLDSAPYLALGYVFTKLSTQNISRDLTQNDIDTLRAEDIAIAAADAEQRQREIYEGDLNQKAARALNDFNTRWKFDLNSDPSIQWDTAKQEAEWALSWQGA